MSHELRKVRQRIYEVQREHARFIQQMLKSRTMIKGSVVTLARACGKAGCKCTRGEKHTSRYLSISEGSKTRMVYLRPGMEMRITQGVDSYRTFRRARARLVKLQKSLIDLFNRLEQIQREEPDAKGDQKESKG